MKQGLITGGSSDLGMALARALVRKFSPFSLLLTGRNKKKLLFIQKELSPHAHVEILVIDLLKKEERSVLLEWIHSHSPDLVINNAGIGLYGNALLHPIQKQLNILELNANVLLEISLHAAQALLSRKMPGTILNVSSAADRLPYPTFSVYAASKAFVTNFSIGFDEEMKVHGIRVLVSSPGPINTDFRKNASQGDYQKEDKRALSPERAAEELLEQVQKGKKTRIFPLKIMIGRFLLLHLFPKWLLYFFLKRGLRNLYKNH